MLPGFLIMVWKTEDQDEPTLRWIPQRVSDRHFIKSETFISKNCKWLEKNLDNLEGFGMSL